MRPDLQYITEKFHYYNLLCFDGQLPLPALRLTTRLHAMGRTIVKTGDSSSPESYVIEISVRLDLPEVEYIDTLVHEMIHYYIEYNHLEDDSMHGRLFMAKKDEIWRKHGVRVTVAYDPTDEELIARRDRVRYVCVLDFASGETGLAVVAKNKVLALWDVMATAFADVERVTWYASDCAIFGKFPTSTRPALWTVEARKLQHYLTGAVMLERHGDTIAPSS